jgi:hypothetical protein
VLVAKLRGPPGRPAAADACQRGNQHGDDTPLLLVAAAPDLGDERHDLDQVTWAKRIPAGTGGGTSGIDGSGTSGQ